MSTKDDGGLDDSMDDWRAAAYGKAELVITVGEIMDCKDSYGDMYIQGKIVIENIKDQISKKRKRIYKSNRSYPTMVKINCYSILKNI